MTRPAFQLHSTRRHDEPLPRVLWRVHEAGFEGVEFAGRLKDADTAAVADALDDTGLVALGAHLSLRTLESDAPTILEEFETLGCRRAVVPHLPPREFRTVERVAELADRFQRVVDDLASHGVDLLYHNSRHDLATPLETPGLNRLLNRGLIPEAVESRLAERLRIQRTDRPAATAIGHLTEFADVELELDAGEVRAAGFDHGPVYDFFGDVLSLVHVCDVTGPSDGYHSTSPETGVLDYGTVFTAAKRNNVDWLIYEHDHPKDPDVTIERGADAVVSRLRDSGRSVA